MKHKPLIVIAILLFALTAQAEEKADPKHLAQVQQRSQHEVPYSLAKTQQTFSKTVHGGIQHVVAKSADDAEQVKLIRAHLLKMVGAFNKGDFSATERMHGADMPGLARLKKAEIGDVRYEYKSLPDGGQIHYSSEYPELVQALHEWFEAQAKDHGSDTISGHSQHHGSPAE